MEKDYASFRNDDLELEVRSVFVRNALMEMEDGEMERMNAYFWFAAPYDFDYWFGYGVSDTCEDGDADAMLIDTNIDDLKRLAIYLGDEWNTIESRCPHCIAMRHRSELDILPVGILKSLRINSLEEIVKIRKDSDWEVLVERTREVSGGMVLSQN